MLRLASLLYSIIGSTLAGTCVVIALVSGITAAAPLIGVAALGFLVAYPVSRFVARRITGLSR